MSKLFTAWVSASCPDPGRRRPWLAVGLAGAVVAASLVTGSLWHELPARFAGGGSFGWPALEAGRWWTLGSSLLLTRDTFMALTMALAVAVALGVYERRVGPGRTLAVALVGHVTGSVVVALGAGALGRTGWPVAERAAANLDYGASMVVAAALGAVASRSGDRRLVRLAILGPAVVLLLHHQLADWAHLVACPAGYLVDGARRPRRATVAALATATFTGWLMVYGAGAVVDATNQIRFWKASPAAAAPAESAVVGVPGVAGLGPPGAVPAGGAEQPQARGDVERLTYTARALGDRPAVAMVYVPAAVERIVPAGGRLPVVVFLHGIPGAPEDWLAGGGLARRLDEEIAAGRFPAALAVVPESATMHDPRAGWTDAPHQPVLRSLRDDLLPAVARRFPAADLDTGRMAVVGVGRGADGALRLAGLDDRFGFAAAIGPRNVAPPAGRTAAVILLPAPSGHRLSARSHWARWRADLPQALRGLVADGFGAPTPAAPPGPSAGGSP
jgi:enterochelin esterase-like enzyme/membrane associated rhomboid family serine protease